MYLLFNINGGELFKNLFEKIMSFDLLLLNVIFHLLAQCVIFSKSLFNLAEDSAGSDPVANKEQKVGRLT